MLYILAIVSEDGKTIYYAHNKIYITKKQAINALKTMIDNKKIHESAKVYEIKSWYLVEVEE